MRSQSWRKHLVRKRFEQILWGHRIRYFCHIPIEGVEGVQKDEKHPVYWSIDFQTFAEVMDYQSRKRPASLIPMDFGSVPRWSALSMMTGKALEYFRAFARCCLHDLVSPDPALLHQHSFAHPPQPVLAFLLGLFLTLEYSIKHCLSRIMLGMLIMNGTKYAPPQFRSGLSVEEMPGDRNMHPDTNKSPRTLAYDVKTSAKSMSPYN